MKLPPSRAPAICSSPAVVDAQVPAALQVLRLMFGVPDSASKGQELRS